MIKRDVLLGLARMRQREADQLFAVGSYDGAYYICGYVMELRLKARMIKTLGWTGFPERENELGISAKPFKIHNLESLLHLSGRLTRVKAGHLVDWSIVSAWDPECRYRAAGSISRADTFNMISATKALSKVI